MKHFLLLLLLSGYIFCKAQTPADLTMPVLLTQIPDSGIVRFTWNDQWATTINIFRREVNTTGWGTNVATIAAFIGTYDDTITAGKRYEYYFRTNRSIQPTVSHTYLAVGTAANPIHCQGKVLLLVDSTMATPLAAEISRLRLDLICDGWMVSQVNSNPLANVTSVRDTVIVFYYSSPSLHHAVFILGHVPVPYAGEINPDGHSEHLGAWPADVYYADVDNSWTDVTVNLTVANRVENRNIPGDGKFDQYIIPGVPKIALGRADFNNMPAFQLSDTLLLQQYLNKDHNYRTKAFTATPRMLVDDNLGYFSAEAFAQNGWRNGSALFGRNNVVNADFIVDAKTNSYLWAYGCGGGSYTSAVGIGNTSNMIADSMKSVFTMMFGSYFGDWDSQDNLLRAPLAAKGYALTNCWAGRPNWFFHTMGMGIPISQSIIQSQYNMDYLPLGYGGAFTHSCFMGDPTLTLNPVLQPTVLSLIENTTNGDVDLTWAASADGGILGYYVYRAPALMDSFVCITPQYINALTYTDTQAQQGNNVYMVRPVKLQTTVTGSYYNVGRGVLDSITVVTIPDGVQENIAAHFTVYPNPSNGLYTIKTNGAKGTYNLELYNTLGEVVWKQMLTAPVTTIDIATQSSGVFYLKISDAKTGTSGYKKLMKIGRGE